MQKYNLDVAIPVKRFSMTVVTEHDPDTHKNRSLSIVTDYDSITTVTMFEVSGGESVKAFHRYGEAAEYYNTLAQ